MTCAADCVGLCAADSALVVVPMFHANAWGMVYAGAMCGAKLVLPGPALDGKSVYALLKDECVTLAFGVPTVWLTWRSSYDGALPREPPAVKASIQIENPTAGIGLSDPSCVISPS